MLRELDVAYEKIVIDISAGEKNTLKSREINSMEKLPALADGQTILTKAAAIYTYLTDKFADKGFLPEINSPQRAM